MRQSNLLVTSLLALGLVIAAGIWLNRKSTPPAKQPLIQTNTTPQPTNHAAVHNQQPSPTIPAPDAPEASDQIGLVHLPPEKIEEYLRLHHRDAASLLAAFHSEPLGVVSYLHEAATNFPNDPRVQWTVLAQNAFPEERRKWLDAFKNSSPSNSLANYLSAQDYLKNGQTEAAVKELLAATGKSQFKDFSMDTILDGESLAQFSGSSDFESHVFSMAAMSGDLMPELSRLKDVANGIKGVQQQYLGSSDPASAQTLAAAGVGLANHLMTGDSGKFLINQLVGIASETIVLQSLDQNTSYDFLGGQTPAQRLANLKQQKVSISQLSKSEPNVISLPPDQMANYWERVKIYGEVEALRWLQQQNPPTPNTGN
jgi:hypothetical protein